MTPPQLGSATPDDSTGERCANLARAVKSAFSDSVAFVASVDAVSQRMRDMEPDRTSPFYDLDIAARANLGANGLPGYERFKQRMIDDGDSEQSIRDTLTGYIWDETEEPYEGD